MKASGGLNGPASMSSHSSTTSTKADSFRRFEIITGVGRRRRWTDEGKVRIVAESLAPATTSSALARRCGLHASQLFVWRQQLAASTALEVPEFVPVVVAEDAATPAETTGVSAAPCPAIPLLCPPQGRDRQVTLLVPRSGLVQQILCDLTSILNVLPLLTHSSDLFVCQLLSTTRYIKIPAASVVRGGKLHCNT